MPEPLSLSPDEMRRLGYRVVDRIVDHLGELRELPPIRVGDAEELRAAVGGPPPELPGEPDAALDALFEQVLPFVQHPDHPRFFARIGSPSNFMSVLGDFLTSGFNVFTGSWTGGSGPSTVELVVLDWLRSICGMPEGSEGVLVTGGSVASLVGLAAARTKHGGGTVFISPEGHASVGRAARLLGLEPRVLPVLSADAVRAAADESALAVAATAGTTSTGAVDPLPELADVCADLGLWLHVDGAYGAPAVLTERGRAVLAGLERADSLVLDPHKWLFQPYEIGCVLVREPELLERTFSLSGVYLRDTLGGEVNFRNRSVQLTRGGRALKLWLSIRTFGLAAFRDAIDHGIALAEHAEALLRERPGWEVVSPAQLAIVCFRRDGDDELQTRLSAAMVADGFAAPSTTEVDGRVVLRLCTINPRTTFNDIEETIWRLDALSGSCALP
ncbi:MAG TPA: aminotransferase class I/II-fold pyridoxal phosphate-dependent enzyme [Solirubrobacteraceae bacterium]|nr:aminotransferase class I/II-fold pyridoxal phosphate-dependent enzyme [Solirubrobacteraceae bacterium]